MIIKKISEMTDADKKAFLESMKLALVKEQGISWKEIEPKILEEIDNTFDDEKFFKMDSEFRKNAAHARNKFGDKKPSIEDYMLWLVTFATKSEYASW